MCIETKYFSISAVIKKENGKISYIANNLQNIPFHMLSRGPFSPYQITKHL